MDPDIVTYEDVEVLADNGMALRCLVDGCDVWVGKLQIQPGTTVVRTGDRGRLVLKSWMLDDLGLKPPRTS